MPDPIVRASRVSYRVDGVPLVGHVDFEAASGELVGVLGPNGAGKSTLLRLLAGDLLPDQGEVTLDGMGTAERSTQDLALIRSMLADHVPNDIPFTVQAVVEMGRYPHRRSPDNSPERDAAAVTEAMLRTDTARFAGRIFATLSSGERARVFLARVLAQDAPIVLLDEPTASLDLANREHILSEAALMARKQRAVVCVLHDVNAAAYYSDRLVLMAEGSIVAAGTPWEVLDPKLLSDVYGQRMHVIEHPFRNCPLVLVGDDPRTTRTGPYSW
ncbi:MAG TPA: heme ABC transporter ATP-binding protein [Acidimicrobiia bacterium]